MSAIIQVTLSDNLMFRAIAVSEFTKHSIAELCAIGLLRMVRGFEDLGAVPHKEPERTLEGKPVPLIPSKLLKRLCALDTALRLNAGHGVSESICENIVRDIKSGDFSLLESGWSFEDIQETRNLLRAFADQWNAEDRQEVAHEA